MNTFRTMAFALTAASLVIPMTAQAKEDPAIKVSDKGAVKGANQVAIGALNVGFIFESTDAINGTRNGGVLAAVGPTTKAKSTLVGVTPEMMQQIADAAYADLVAQLTAQGFTVTESSTVFLDSALLGKGTTEPTEISVALEKKSKGKATYVSPRAIPRQIMMLGDVPTTGGFGNIGNQMSWTQNGIALANYAKNAGTPVITATYLIDFSDQQRPGAFSFSGIKVNANLSVVPGYSKMTAIGANGKQTVLTVGQPISVDGEFIDKADASSGLDKTSQAAGNVAVGVASALSGLGGLGFGKTRKFSFNAKVGQYEEGAAKAASLTNQRMVDQLASLR